MNRWLVALSLSLSLAAIGVAGFSFLEPRRHQLDALSSSQDAERHMAGMVEALEARLADLESSRSSRPVRVSDHALARAAARSGSTTAELHGKVAALAARLSALEDDETIAELAARGHEQIVVRDVRSAIDVARDREAPPADRLRALRTIRGAAKKNRKLTAAALKGEGMSELDLLSPMLEIAKDTSLDGELRAEVVHGLRSKHREVRAPLLELLTSDPVPEVRTGAVKALLWHLEDADVRAAIIEASGSDTDEQVRHTAERVMPKVRHFERETPTAAEKSRGGKDQSDSE